MRGHLLARVGVAAAALLLPSAALPILSLRSGGADDTRYSSCQGPPLRAPLFHLARCDRGARVRTSSADLARAHHPIFLIDGRVGGIKEKWMSFLRDAHPWAEVSFPSPRLVGRVVLHHAGEREDASYTTSDFTLRVQVGDAWSEVAAIRDNHAAVTAHDFAQRPVSAIRVDITRPGHGADPRARLYEIEAFER